jgi:hypothetical protein
LKFFNNPFLDTTKIDGFTKEELVEIKRALTTLVSEHVEQSKINEFLRPKFPVEILELYANYIDHIKNFINHFIALKEEQSIKIDFNYYHLKSEILNELKRLYDNLLNLKLNIQNSRRFLKVNSYLDDILSKVQNFLNESDTIRNNLERSLNRSEVIQHDYGTIWIESNKIMNLNFKINKIPIELENWDEISKFYDFLEKNVDNLHKKKKNKKKKEYLLTAYFNDIFQYYNKNQDGKISFYSDLILLLFQKKILEIYESEEEELEEYVNIMDKKEIGQKLKKFIEPVVRVLIKDKLKNTLDEITELNNKFKLEDDNNKFNLNTLLEQKFRIYLPNIADYYLSGLEKKYQNTIAELKDYDEFKNISKFYSEKISIFYNLIEEIEKYIINYSLLLKPYSEIIDSFKQIITNVYEEITRRRDEYLFYLKTIKNERLRDSVRNYINQKILEVNDLMNKYQDETSIIVREELPQIKQIRNIFSDYKANIQKLKEEVYKKLDEFKEKDIDIYQIIKQWEENFTRKRQQLNFLFGILMNKLYKNFKDLIDQEELLADNIKEITEQDGNINNIPLNFALSKILVDKLTEEELSERIKEIHLKIENLTKQANLYQNELSNLEITLKNKVKIREGIETDKVVCGVCHKNINLGKEQLIKCPFCGAVYHYLCVAFWLSKYNSCPSCQNVFLDPNAGIYENQE